MTVTVLKTHTQKDGTVTVLKTYTQKDGTVWEWEETPELVALLKAIEDYELTVNRRQS